jgi:SagB-type dehydrogenase family enzyme
MNHRILTIGVIILAATLLAHDQRREEFQMGTQIELPKPNLTGDMSVEQALSQRQSRRSMGTDNLTLAQVSQILWAAQGITRDGFYRTAPSAGALYPVEIYLVSEKVDDLPQGLYHYDPDHHTLETKKSGSMVEEISGAALGQSALIQAAVHVIVTAEISRTAVKYGDRAEQYVAQETGAIAQNIYLQVESLGLSTVFIGAFYDDLVQEVLEIAETPFAIMPIGHRDKVTD